MRRQYFAQIPEQDVARIKRCFKQPAHGHHPPPEMAPGRPPEDAPYLRLAVAPQPSTSGFPPQGRVVSQEVCLHDLKQSIRSGQAWNARSPGNHGKAGHRSTSGTSYAIQTSRSASTGGFAGRSRYARGINKESLIFRMAILHHNYTRPHGGIACRTPARPPA